MSLMISSSGCVVASADRVGGSSRPSRRRRNKRSVAIPLNIVESTNRIKLAIEALNNGGYDDQGKLKDRFSSRLGLGDYGGGSRISSI
jgi:hypothetical protein